MLVGYADRFSVRPGERIAFMVSCEPASEFRADIVRLVHGDTNPAGPGFKEELVETAAGGDYPARRQEIYAGSHAEVPDHPLLRELTSFALSCYIWPTTPAKGVQGLLTKWDPESSSGYGLFVNESGAIELWLGDGERVQHVSTGRSLVERVWYLATASVDAEARTVSVEQTPVIGRANGRFALGGVDAAQASAALEVTPGRPAVPFLIAARPHFNGKIDRPRVSPVAAWDFHASITPAGVATDEVQDVSGNGLHGRTVNLPARAMTGYNWRSDVDCFTQAPDQYGAIHFHDDDLADAGWEVDFVLDVDPGTSSGVYAGRLRAGDDEDYVPFVIRPAPESRTAPIALVLPTASYLAYANNHSAFDAPLGQPIIAHVPVLERWDLYLDEHRELGLSCYDSHSDGSGVCYSSRRRPILSVRPKVGAAQSPSVWQFNADLHLVDWLTVKGFDFDVLTDEDLQLEGSALLRPYAAVLTGSHPEYCSTQMLDAYYAYVEESGRLMYMGGNGFYWVTQYHPEDPAVIELRRWGGSQTWRAESGESYLSFSGEQGGIWRNRGRAPQKLVGVGFRSEGFDVSSYFRRNPDSFDERAAWIFEGVGAHELIGDFGLVGGGAAGVELDVYDTALGTPPDALLLASSERHADTYIEVVEEIWFNAPGAGGTENPRVRADLVYFTTPGGGAVFSTGSIAWCGSLSHGGYENNVSRITENVLRRFSAAEPLHSNEE